MIHRVNQSDARYKNSLIYFIIPLKYFTLIELKFNKLYLECITAHTCDYIFFDIYQFNRNNHCYQITANTFLLIGQMPTSTHEICAFHVWYAHLGVLTKNSDYFYLEKYHLHVISYIFYSYVAERWLAG